MTDVSEVTIPETARRRTEETPFRLPAALNRPAAPALLLIFLTLTVYWRILGFSFLNFDDGTNIVNNPYLNPLTLKGIGYLWTHSYNDLYMPVTSTIWGLCAYLSPIVKPIFVPGIGNVFISPVAFHALSLFLHSANALLVYFLLNRIIKKPWAACAGALLFALHPVQIESVAWVTGLNNLLSGFFSLLALHFYLSSADGSARSPGMARLRYVWATLFFVVALLSKPTAAALPLAAAALDWGTLNRRPAQWLRSLLPWAVFSAALAIVTSLNSENSRGLHLAFWARPFIAGDALAYYLSKLFFPYNVSFLIAGRTMYLVKASWWGYVTWLFPLAVGLLIWRAGRPARLLQTGAAVFILSLLPMLGFVVFYAMALSTVANRYLYLAMLGAGLAAAWFAGDERIKPAVRAGACCLVLFLLTAQTVHLLPNWKDSETLAKAQMELNPQDHMAQSNYGVFLIQRGKIPESLPHLRAAVNLKPDNAIDHYQLGATLEDFGDLTGAAASLRESVRLDPRLTEAQINLGGVLLKLGQNREAIAPLRKAVEIAPRDSSAGYLLGIALASAQQYSEAEAQFRRVLSLSSDMPQARQALGRVLEKQKRPKEAAQVYREILRTAPDDPEAKKGIQRTGA